MELNDKHNRYFDVIIVGGGPSGLHTASFLADYGISVALFEKNSEIGRDVVCSGVISREAFSRYDLPQEAIVGRLKEANLFSPRGISIYYSHPEEAVVVVDRHIFDKKLAENAIRKGARIFLDMEISSISVNDEHVKAFIKTKEGNREVNAKICVIATGINYHLQSSLGLGRPKKILKGIQVETRLEQIKHLRMYWGSRFSTSFFGWAIPLIDGRTRIGVITEGDAINGLNNVMYEVFNYKDAYPEQNKIKRRGIAFGTITRSYSDKIIVVGEAAGLIKTTTGGGIYYGLLSAEMASEVIKKAFNTGKFNAKTLSRYENLWKGTLGKEIKYGEYFNKFFSKLCDDSLDQLFDAAIRDDLIPYIKNNGKFDWHKGAIVKIIRSPNLRRVIWNGF